METVWQPANEIEYELVHALQEENSRQFALLVQSARLYLPVLPEPGSADWQELSDLLPLEQRHVLVYTSAEALADVFGRFTSGHVEISYDELIAGWPTEEELYLALNPGLPIGFVGPVGAIDDLAEGRESLVAIGHVQEAVRAELRGQIRQAVLAELGAESKPSFVPTNPLETELVAALADGDENEYLTALMSGEVLVLTSQGAAGEDALWWVLETPTLPIVVAFSSRSIVEEICPSAPPGVVLPFLAVLTDWPSVDHALCFNPGTETELILTGDGLRELLNAATQALSSDHDQP